MPLGRRRSPPFPWVSTATLVLVFSAFCAALSPLFNDATPTAIVPLYPEHSRDFEKHLCGDVQLYHVHDLDPHRVYDLKISYPASLPTSFSVDVQELLLSPTTMTADGAVVRKVPRRMLNTEKLRLRPLELLREWSIRAPFDGVVGKAQQQRDERFRFDALPKDEVLKLQQGEFIVEIAVRGDVEGVSPVLDLSQRICVYNIVVEEVLLEAFPRDTLVLIVWLVVLVGLALRVAFPFVSSLIALERVEDQQLSALKKDEDETQHYHTKTS